MVPVSAHAGERAAPTASIPFDLLREPGTYICNWSGQLLRVPRETLARGPLVNLIGREPLFVTRISPDPTLPLHAARDLAQAWHLTTSF